MALPGITVVGAVLDGVVEQAFLSRLCLGKEHYLALTRRYESIQESREKWAGKGGSVLDTLPSAS